MLDIPKQSFGIMIWIGLIESMTGNCSKTRLTCFKMSGSLANHPRQDVLVSKQSKIQMTFNRNTIRTTRTRQYFMTSIIRLTFVLPTVSKLCAIGMTPVVVTRLCEGRKPKIPQYDAGTLILPAVSVPTIVPNIQLVLTGIINEHSHSQAI